MRHCAHPDDVWIQAHRGRAGAGRALGGGGGALGARLGRWEHLTGHRNPTGQLKLVASGRHPPPGSLLCVLYRFSNYLCNPPPAPPSQDPSYPVYVDTSVMMGMTGDHNGTGFDGIEYMVRRQRGNGDLGEGGEGFGGNGGGGGEEGGAEGGCFPVRNTRQRDGKGCGWEVGRMLV